MKNIALALILAVTPMITLAASDEQERAFIDQVIPKTEQTKPDELTQKQMATKIDLLRARTVALLNRIEQLEKVVQQRTQQLAQIDMVLAQQLVRLTNMIECLATKPENKEFLCVNDGDGTNASYQLDQ